MASIGFKVIIVGGGLVGLTAAHALRHADVDFVVLERREDPLIDEGAAIVLGPTTLRIMHQLGLLDKLTTLGNELLLRKCFTADGYLFKNAALFEHMKQHHGISPFIFHRADLMRTLYESMPEVDKKKILTGMTVTAISSTDAGASVTCSDGSVHHGSMILGADGSHSKVRSLMRQLALESDPSSDWDAANPYLSSYRSIWFTFPSNQPAGWSFETQHKDRSIMYMTGRGGRSWVNLYEKLPAATRERMRYTTDDTDAMAASFDSFVIAEGLRLGDVYRLKSTHGMANLEEGVVDHWTWGRVVIAGDACHKYSPNSGMGYQNGVTDVVSLCNNLHAAILLHSRDGDQGQGQGHGGLPLTDLRATLKAYETDRSRESKKDSLRAAKVIRSHTWASTGYYLMARWLMPLRLFDWAFMKFQVAPKIAMSAILEYVPSLEPFKGTVPWQNPMRAKQKWL